MPKRLLAALAVGIVLVRLVTAEVFAQEPDPADEAKAFLTAKGYTVTDVNYSNDDHGKPLANSVYVLMDAVGGDLDQPDLQAQVIWGFAALSQYYPRVELLNSILAYKQYWIMFHSTSQDFVFPDATLPGATFWSQVRSQVRIYDRVKNSFVDEKDFTGDQTVKDQAGKDFGATPSNPVPTPIPSALPGGTLWLEPSTTYLPADKNAQAAMMATLLDSRYAPLANRPLAFSYQAPGDDAQSAGTQSTDANGAARAHVAGSRDFNSLLLRASTESLNSQVSIVVGPVPATKADEIKAAVRGLSKQGYAGVDVSYYSDTSATGELTNYATVEMRMESQTFDRTVYSQLSRGMGTLRTMFPKANEVDVGLIFHKDGHDWELLWSAQVAYWDQLVAGQISENEFWRNLRYEGAFDENGNRLDDKDFVDKNFGAGAGKSASVTRTLESAITHEDWGDQWHGQEFVVLPGSYADSFGSAIFDGNATALQIFQSPDFTTPIVTYARGDNADKLAGLRLGQGQYLFAVVGPTAPASAQVTYVEHLPD